MVKKNVPKQKKVPVKAEVVESEHKHEADPTASISSAVAATGAGVGADAGASTADPVTSNTAAVFDDPNLLSALFGNVNSDDMNMNINMNVNMGMNMNMDMNDPGIDHPGIDDDDEIIREIDVYISPELANTMQLIQFPLQPASHIHTQARAKNAPDPPPPQPTSAKIKPQHSMLELSYNIPRSSFSSQRQIPAPLALSERTFDSHLVPIVTHMAIGIFDRGVNGDSGSGKGSGNNRESSRDKIDLVPLQNIVQMRPSFAHVDAIYENSAENDREEETIDLSADKKDKDSTTTTPIVFQKPESERATSQRLSSYAYKKAHEDAEEWLDLDVQGYKSIARREAMEKVHCCRAHHQSRNRNRNNNYNSSQGGQAPPIPISSSSSMVSTNDDLQFIKGGTLGGSVGYVKSLNYLPSTVIVESVEDFTIDEYQNEDHDNENDGNENDGNDGTGGRNTPTMGNTTTTNTETSNTNTNTTSSNNEPTWKKELTARVATLLQERGGFPLPFSVIRSRFQPSIPDSALIEATSASAVLVRGNFILKTSLMALSNVYVENARDVILILMRKYGVVQRVKLYKAFQGCSSNSNGSSSGSGSGNKSSDNDNNAALIVTMDVINSLLELMGKRTTNGVEMKIDDDLIFESEYPHVARKHAIYWDRKEKELKKYIRLYEGQDDVVDTNELSEMFSGTR